MAQLQPVRFGADGSVGTNRFGPRGPRRWPWHAHDVHELLWDAHGPLEAETDHGWFAVPPGYGLWIPAGCAHEVTAGDGVPFACTFLGGEPPEGVGARTVVVTVVPAVAELLALLSDADLPPTCAAGSSARTASRRFREQTGTTFAQWRTAVRMRAAVGLLASGMPVVAVARHVGYTSPSAFVQSFRATVGTTPGAYAGTVASGRAS